MAWLRPGYHAHDATVSLRNPSLATRIRNSASGIRTMHSPGPPAQQIAWRHGTSGRSTSCASHHAYPIRTPKLGRVIHVDGCTTRSLDIGKALSHSLTSLYIHTRLISFLHRNILITRYTCLSALIVFIPANIDANLYQCLTNVEETINMLCKWTVLAIVLLILQACANVILGDVRPACNSLLPKARQGCLRGQTCLPDNS